MERSQLGQGPLEQGCLMNEAFQMCLLRHTANVTYHWSSLALLLEGRKELETFRSCNFVSHG